METKCRQCGRSFPEPWLLENRGICYPCATLGESRTRFQRQCRVCGTLTWCSTARETNGYCHACKRVECRRCRAFIWPRDAARQSGFCVTCLEEIRPRPKGDGMSKSPCPCCGSARVLPILYGLIDERKACLPPFIRGGCCVTGKDPEWGCTECGEEWPRRGTEVAVRSGERRLPPSIALARSRRKGTER